MQKLSSLLFCIASLALMTGAMWVLFPLAARTSEQVQASNTPQGAEMFDDVDLGDFGHVPVLDMMQHYIENPPLESAAADNKVRFQGC